MHLEDFRYPLDELIPLFNLSVEMEEIKIKGFIVEKLIEDDEEKIRSELGKIISDREAGNFLAKDKDKMDIMIYDYKEKYKALKQIAEDYDGIIRSKEALREELLIINLKEKLGMKLLEEDDFIHKDTLKVNFESKKRLERELKEQIDWLQEKLEEYKKKFK